MRLARESEKGLGRSLERRFRPVKFEMDCVSCDVWLKKYTDLWDAWRSGMPVINAQSLPSEQPWYTMSLLDGGGIGRARGRKWKER